MYPGLLGPPGASVPAQWAADPSGRHHWRWWSGFDWTAHVDHGGAVAEDPLDVGGGAPPGDDE